MPRSCLIADRAYDDADACRASKGGRALSPFSGPGPAPASPQPHVPARYRARNAVVRGIGWLQCERRVAIRYAPHTHVVA